MDYFFGVTLAISTLLFTKITGFQRDRSLYPVILLVVASYYILFAVMAGGGVLLAESVGFAVFAFAATIGFRTNLWIVAVALAGHGLFDWFHEYLIENPGTPAWWPMFCMSFDVVAGVFLALQLLSGNIQASIRPSFGERIRSSVNAELAAAQTAQLDGDPAAGFRHLERSHILGQSSTVQHVRVHVRMLIWGARQRDFREVVGQLLRVVGAAAGTWLGLVPSGNTGGANVNGFQSMEIPADLTKQIVGARSSPFQARKADHE